MRVQRVVNELATKLRLQLERVHKHACVSEKWQSKLKYPSVQSGGTTAASAHDMLTSQESEREVWWMLERVSTKTKSQWLTHDLCNDSYTSVAQGQSKKVVENIIDQPSWQPALEELVRQRSTGMPLQYVLGRVPFGEIELLCRPPVFIPRPETDQWCSWLTSTLAKHLHMRPELISGLNVLDLCTGSGAIAVSLAHQLPRCRVFGVERDPVALQLAHDNREFVKEQTESDSSHSMENLRFINWDINSNTSPMAKFVGRIDIIVSNPPYISQHEWNTLPRSVRAFEQHEALVTSGGGLDMYKRISELVPLFLRSTSRTRGLPRVVFETGLPWQSTPITQYLWESAGLVGTTHNDMYGRPRWVAAYDDIEHQSPSGGRSTWKP
jgi:release factor glutamine methyltransferase